MLFKLRVYTRGFWRALHLRLGLANLVCGLLPDFFSGVIRARIYRLAGIKIGAGSFIMGNLELLGVQKDFYRNLEVGSDVLISNHVTINLDEKVIVGDNVTLSPFVRIYTSTHKVGPSSRRCLHGEIVKPVIIEKGSWVALGATILPGVRIGYGSIVAAGAVITRDIPPNSFVAGVPGKVIKNLPCEDGYQSVYKEFITN